MDTKLTIRLNKRIIEDAKAYAVHRNISLSKLIEAYLESLTRLKSKNIEISPLVEKLSGVIQLVEDYDFKKDYTEFLSEKYK